MTTKDLHTGECFPSVSRTDTFISRTDILRTVHLNIPPPHDAGQVFMTSTTDRPPVLESTNQYSILPIEEANDSSVDAQVVRVPPKLTKHLASSSLRVKASNEKTTTISSPTLTAPHQSRPPLGELHAAVTLHDQVGRRGRLASPSRKPFRMTTNCPDRRGMQGKHQKFQGHCRQRPQFPWPARLGGRTTRGIWKRTGLVRLFIRHKSSLLPPLPVAEGRVTPMLEDRACCNLIPAIWFGMTPHWAISTKTSE